MYTFTLPKFYRLQMSGGSATYEVELSVSAEGDGTWLRGPHDHAGFVPFCKDGFNGQMELRVWQRPGLLGKILAALADLFGMQKSRPRGKLVVEAHSAACAVECGGEPWDGTWESECTVPQLLLDTLRNPVDGDKVADAVGGSNDSS